MVAKLALSQPAYLSDSVAMQKRTVQVGIRLSEDDLAKLQRAARAAWPGARLSQAAAILSLALREADKILGEEKQRKKP